MGNRKTGGSEPRNGTSPAGDEKFSLISDAKLIALYRNLVECRRSGDSKGVSLAGWGHEAAVVGTTIDLGPGDVVCSIDLQILAGVTDGDALQKLLSESNHNGRSGSREEKSAAQNGHAGTPFSHAVLGTALARKTAKNGTIAVVYANGKNPDCLNEMTQIAAAHALPIIFVQQLDGDAEWREKNSQPLKTKTTDGVELPWYPSIAVDTDDLVAVYRVAYESISRARLGRGPTLIECHTLRPSAGSTNGKGRHTGDAVRNMEHYLRAKGLSPHARNR